jgi:hypothetical protein
MKKRISEKREDRTEEAMKKRPGMGEDIEVTPEEVQKAEKEQ